VNTATKMIVVLTIVTMFSGGLLAYWDAFTASKIEFHRQEALKAAISEVIPEHDRYEIVQKSGFDFYVGLTEKEIVGIAFQAAGSGFQGKIMMMVGMTPDFETVTGMKILEQIETPGLGTKIVEDPTNRENPYWFPQQFRNKPASEAFTVVKNRKPAADAEIEAITGATISSKAVVVIINQFIRDASRVFKEAEKVR